MNLIFWSLPVCRSPRHELDQAPIFAPPKEKEEELDCGPLSVPSSKLTVT